MKQRIITGVFFAAAACVILYFSNVIWFFRAVVAALTLCSLFELYRLKSGLFSGIGCAVAAAGACLLAIFPMPYYQWVLGGCFAAALLAFLALILLLERKHRFTMRPLPLVLCQLLVVLFFHAGIGLREREHGLIYLIFSVLIPVVTDTFAYFGGRFFGKHKLMPVTSPKKTVEGAVSGTLSALLIALLVGALYGRVDYPSLCVFVVSASVVGQLGDLSMSALKRIAGVKDYGSIFPGHGGFLDRFDSILFVWPLTYLVCCLGFDFLK